MTDDHRGEMEEQALLIDLYGELDPDMLPVEEAYDEEDDGISTADGDTDRVMEGGIE